jgi:stage IV sporulation protein FB
MLNFVQTIILVAASVAIHEWVHVFAIRFMGGKVESVKFFPLGMMARARRLERLHGWERYVVFAAGPVANFAIAFWAWFTSHTSYVGVAWMDALAFYNIVLGVFNLTPVLPLDGGRILWQFLGNRVGILRASRYLKKLGMAVAWCYIFLGMVQAVLFPFNITLLCAGIFILKKNKTIQPELQAAFHAALDGKNSAERARTLPIKTIKISPETPIKEAFERLAGDYFIEFQMQKKQRPLRERTLLEYIFKHGITGTVGDIPI